jgi:hypothetical protein
VSSFQVSPESLFTGSALMATSGASVGSAAWSGVSGAAAQTPVAGAWSDFVERAGQALVDVDEVSGDLSRALSTAATAYVVSDDATAASMEGSG